MEGAAIKEILYAGLQGYGGHIERTALPAASVIVQFEDRANRWNFVMRITMSIGRPSRPIWQGREIRLEPAVPGLLREFGKRTGIPA